MQVLSLFDRSTKQTPGVRNYTLWIMGTFWNSTVIYEIHIEKLFMKILCVISFIKMHSEYFMIFGSKNQTLIVN